MSQFLQKFAQGMKVGSNLFQNRLTQQRMFLTNQFWRQSMQGSGISQVVQNEEHNFQGEQQFQQKKGFNYWVAGLVPLFLFLEEQRRKKDQINCFWSKSNLKKNRITGRIASTEYNANDPIEDRHVCKQLKNIDAFVCAVFDGHGGWSLSEYASKLLIDEIDLQLEQLKKNNYQSEEQYISEAITKAYEYIEISFYELAIQGKIARPFNVGSCALVTLIKDDKVYSANIGDCKGVIISEKGKEFAARKINHKQNANSKKEQDRLKKTFPQDQDIVICKRNNETACYVKGRLMPTRAFGDYHLKIKDHFKGKGQFNGPYITAKPEIQVHQLKKEDKFIVMASDGLWDEMNKSTIAKIAYQNKDDRSKIVTELLNSALQHAADDKKLTIKQLSEIPAGERRKLHDDITIVCVDLSNQSK